jgi:hypothetical protein
VGSNPTPSARQAIRRGTFTSVPDLIGAIRIFIDAYNESCRPFQWTKTADQILTKAKPQRTSDTRHQMRLGQRWRCPGQRRCKPAVPGTGLARPLVVSGEAAVGTRNEGLPTDDPLTVALRARPPAGAQPSLEVRLVRAPGPHVAHASPYDQGDPGDDGQAAQRLGEHELVRGTGTEHDAAAHHQDTEYDQQPTQAAHAYLPVAQSQEHMLPEAPRRRNSRPPRGRPSVVCRKSFRGVGAGQ